MAGYFIKFPALFEDAPRPFEVVGTQLLPIAIVSFLDGGERRRHTLFLALIGEGRGLPRFFDSLSPRPAFINGPLDPPSDHIFPPQRFARHLALAAWPGDYASHITLCRAAPTSRGDNLQGDRRPAQLRGIGRTSPVEHVG